MSKSPLPSAAEGFVHNPINVYDIYIADLEEVSTAHNVRQLAGI
ncbi:hypothetical protein [Cyclobacterium roseum]|nr:hypothetical protein [Cyclobacterium roseum]